MTTNTEFDINHIIATYNTFHAEFETDEAYDAYELKDLRQEHYSIELDRLEDADPFKVAEEYRALEDELKNNIDTVYANALAELKDGPLALHGLVDLFRRVLEEANNFGIETDDSADYFNAAMGGLYDIAILQLEFYDGEELTAFSRDHKAFIKELQKADGGVIKFNSYRDSIKFQLRFLQHKVDDRLAKLERLDELLAPTISWREQVIEQIVRREWEAMSLNDARSYYINSQSDYYSESLTDAELLALVEV